MVSHIPAKYPFIAIHSLVYFGPDKALSMGQIELFEILTKYKQITYAELNCLK